MQCSLNWMSSYPASKSTSYYIRKYYGSSIDTITTFYSPSPLPLSLPFSSHSQFIPLILYTLLPLLPTC